jgi:hypothetical protein
VAGATADRDDPKQFSDAVLDEAEGYPEMLVPSPDGKSVAYAFFQMKQTAFMNSGCRRCTLPRQAVEAAAPQRGIYLL